jgi:hypothetical protein
MDQSLALGLSQAIHVLFSSQQPSWTSQQKQAANSFLFEASARKDCFAAALNLLFDPQEAVVVKFFASNILYDKVY